ncbi:hypothetical protein NLU13_0814 [Sarocladium strictum]|uniref:Protein bir1 n=1 Tax=Sarocladium strictum TaxID=5046 RepID=A0AA39GPR9_SARSR|nr:hypothetical protein NLU13_0814 [Sarocladium strictum]
MSADSIDDQYFTYDGRLASFRPTKKRASTTGGRAAKPLNWPHKRIAPASLASAGFFFSPTPDHPDNVICFLCHKGLDGWEEGDDPLQEHLNHTSGCGWATVAAIEAEIGEYHLGDPSAPEMVAARKATFAGRWPHDSKRGWKCKTKQLVDSGWKYTPTPESDDMATCVYCQLALDGWEPNDKPLDEHYKRAPNCPFFTLASQTHGASKKTTRAKGARSSKASRASLQSTITAPSEIGSVDELTVANDDTILTTTSTMTAGGKKPRAKKATTAKGRKTKTKEESVELEEPQPAVEEEATPQPSPPKPKRGKKRGSDAVEESTLTVAEAPAPKKRATRGKANKAVESAVIEPSDAENEEPQVATKPAPKKRGRPSKAQTSRKASNASRTSTTSMASTQAETMDLDEDDEIERQLQADLERPLTDDEDIMADSDSERFKAKSKPAPARKTTSTAQSADFAIFDPHPVEIDDAVVEEELKQLQAEMHVDEPEQLRIPKKGRKAAPRKVSKQTKPKKPKAAPEPEPEPQAEFEDVPLENEPEPLDEPPQQEDSLGSTDTVVRNTDLAPAKRPRGRPSKLSIASAMSDDELDVVDLVEEPLEEPVEEPHPPVKRPRGRPSKASLASRSSSEGAPKRKPGRPKKIEEPLPVAAPEMQPVVKPQPRKVSRTKAPSPPPVEDEILEDQIYEEPSSPMIAAQLAPATPPRAITKAQSAKQATVSPSPSPQSSDAENQPPSSRPSATTTKRIPLAPIAETPAAVSPSKRNVIAGLQSTTPWTAVDIDAMLGTPRHGSNKENGTERFIKKGKELTSPEKEMTVEEWVYYNAGQAETMLKQECEAMVSRFESEGARAMNVLEGLVVD